MADRSVDLVWHRVLDPDELPEGRVKPVTCEHRTVCVTHFEGAYGALGIRVERREELDATLEEALGHDGPSLVEVMTDPELV